ncbi:conserved Plasmodium protein, unknown function [Plasmodium ovale]|uniref:Uncharacterized protein n=1 Tax=Plasmodium ovale TaxID=36330 RepID=A0A1C3KRN3_PLAOA|nr:conserved Plasmodium protein, unknown function [Plasmodium ovale]
MKKGNIKNFELEEIVFILLNCLDEEKKVNLEIVNTLKIYMMYHKCEILNYVFSFLQIQKVSHDNQKLLLYLTYDFIHYCVYNTFSNTVESYLEEPEKGDIIQNEQICSESKNVEKFMDIDIFNNILKYSFFDGDEYCFFYENYLEDCDGEEKHIESGNSGSKSSNSEKYAQKCLPRNQQCKNFTNVFDHNKISRLKCLRKEEYKALLMNKTDCTNKCSKGRIRVQRGVSKCSNSHHSDSQNNKQSAKYSEINNIVKNVINFILNEFLFIKKNDERHNIMTRLLILCIIMEDTYLKKKIMEKVNHYIGLCCGGNDHTGRISNVGGDSHNANTHVYTYLELYVDIFLQMPHLAKSALIDIFRGIISLGSNNKHIDMIHRIFLKIFEDIQFPSILYSIIYMNSKYKKKNFLLPNERNNNVFIENDIIQLSLENTSEDTCTTYTRESSLNSNHPNKMNSCDIVNYNISQRRVYQKKEKREPDSTGGSAIGSGSGSGSGSGNGSGAHQVGEASPVTLVQTSPQQKSSNEKSVWVNNKKENNFASVLIKDGDSTSSASESHNVVVCSNKKDISTQEYGEDLAQGGCSYELVNANSLGMSPNGENGNTRTVSNSQHSKENRRSRSTNDERSHVRRGGSTNTCAIGVRGEINSIGAGVTVDIENELERKKAENINDVCRKLVDMYFSTIVSMKCSNDNYVKVLYIISKLMLYVNNEDSIRKTLEIFLFYFFVFFNSTVNNVTMYDTSCIYNNDSQMCINYANMKTLPDYTIINSFRIVLQYCLGKVHHIVTFTNQVLMVSYSLLYIFINRNYSANNSKIIAKQVISNGYVSTFIEIMEIFSIFISCVYTNNSVFNIIKEKLKSNNKVEIIVTLMVLKQYILLQSSDINSGNIIYLTNQNIKKKRSNGKNSFKRLNSFIMDTRHNNANIELIIESISGLCERFNNDLSIIYILLEITLILSYYNYFSHHSYNPNVLFSLLPKVCSPLSVLHIHKGRCVKGIRGSFCSQSSSDRFSSECENVQDQKIGKVDKCIFESANENVCNNSDERINLGNDEREIKTWLLIPNKHIISIFQFFMNIMLSNETNFKVKSKRYGYYVDDNGTIFDMSNSDNEVLKNGYAYNKMFYDTHLHYFVYMYPTVGYMKQLILEAFQHNFSLYSPRILYPLLLQYLINVKSSYKIVLVILKCLNLICISLHNNMVKKKLRIHSRLHYNCVALPHMSKIVAVLLMYSYHPNYAVSFLSVQLVSIITSFTQNRNIMLIQDLTYFELLFKFLQLNEEIKKDLSSQYNHSYHSCSVFYGENVYSRKAIAYMEKREKKQEKNKKDISSKCVNGKDTRISYHTKLIKLGYMKIAKMVSKKLLNTYLKSYSPRYSEKRRKKINALIGIYFNLDVREIVNLVAAHSNGSIDIGDSGIGGIGISGSGVASIGIVGSGMSIGGKLNDSHSDSVLCSRNVELRISRFVSILRLSREFFESYVKREMKGIYNRETYAIIFFYQLVELLRIIQSSNEFEDTLFYVSLMNMLCVVVKFLKGEYTNKLITILFRLNDEVTTNEEDNIFLTLYMNFSHIYKKHFFNLYKERCTTLYTKKCIECIQLLRTNNICIRRSSETQIDFNNFILLSNKYNSDMSKQKNVENVLQYLGEYTPVYKIAIEKVLEEFNPGGKKGRERKGRVEGDREGGKGEGDGEGGKGEGDGEGSKGEGDGEGGTGEGDMNSVLPRTDCKMDPLNMESSVRSYVNIEKNKMDHLDKIRKKLDQSNDITKKLYEILEDKMSIYVLQNDINFSINKIFKQEVTACYIEGVLQKRNLLRTLFLLNIVYYSDVANKKSSAFSIFGKSNNVVNAENIRNTLILSMGLSIKRIPSKTFHYLYTTNQVLLNNKIFTIYVQYVYTPLVRCNRIFENLIFKKNESSAGNDVLLKEIIGNRKRCMDEMYGEEMETSLKIWKDLSAQLSREDDYSKVGGANGRDALDMSVTPTTSYTSAVTTSCGGTRISNGDIKGECENEYVEKGLPKELNSLFTFQLLADPIICALYQEKEAALQLSLLKSLKRIAKKLKRVRSATTYPTAYPTAHPTAHPTATAEVAEKEEEKTKGGNGTDFFDKKKKRCVIIDICENYIGEKKSTDIPFYSCMYIYKHVIIYSSLYYLANVSNLILPITSLNVTGVEKFAIYFQFHKDLFMKKSEYQLRERMKECSYEGESNKTVENDDVSTEEQYIKEITKLGEKMEMKIMNMSSNKIIYNDYFSQLIKDNISPNEEKENCHLTIDTQSYEMILSCLKTIYYSQFIKKHPLTFQSVLLILNILINLLLKIVLNERKRLYQTWLQKGDKTNGNRQNVKGNLYDTDERRRHYYAPRGRHTLKSTHDWRCPLCRCANSKNGNPDKGHAIFPHRHCKGVYRKSSNEKQFEERENRRKGGKSKRWNPQMVNNMDGEGGSGGEGGDHGESGHHQFGRIKKRGRRGKGRIGPEGKTFQNLRGYEKMSLLCLNFIISIIVKSVLDINSFFFLSKVIKYIHDTCVSTNVDEVKFISFRIITEMVINSPVCSEKENTTGEKVVDVLASSTESKTGNAQMGRALNGKATKRKEGAPVREETKENYQRGGHRNGSRIGSLLPHSSSNFEKYFSLIFSRSGDTAYDSPFDMNFSNGEQVNCDEVPRERKDHRSDNDRGKYHLSNNNHSDDNNLDEETNMGAYPYEEVSEAVHHESTLNCHKSNNYVRANSMKGLLSVDDERKGENHYLCECIGLLIPYVRDKEKIIQYFSTCSVCVLIGKLVKVKILRSTHFIYIFFNSLEVILYVIDKMANYKYIQRKMHKRGEKVKRKMGKLVTHCSNEDIQENPYPCYEKKNTIEEVIINHSEYFAQNDYEKISQETYPDEEQQGNEKTFYSDDSVNHKDYTEENTKHDITYETMNSIKSQGNYVYTCRKKEKDKFSFKKIRYNLYNIEFHKKFFSKILSNIEKINNGKYEKVFLKSLVSSRYSKNDNMNLLKRINEIICNDFSIGEKKSYINMLISCIHNKDKCISMNGLNLLMFYVYNEKMKKDYVENVMNRIFSELYYYTKMNILNEKSGRGNEQNGRGNEQNGRGNEQNGRGNEQNGRGNEKSGRGNEKSGRGNEQNGRGNENELNNTLDAYYNIYELEKNRRRHPNVLERALYVILLLCRKHFYVMVKKLCTLQSKYTYEHTYFIYMICNSEVLLSKTLDYIFYVMNNFHLLRINSNMSNLLSLLFHILKFRNRNIKNYTRRYFVELFLIVFFVLGVKQLSHVGGGISGNNNVGEKSEGKTPSGNSTLEKSQIIKSNNQEGETEKGVEFSKVEKGHYGSDTMKHALDSRGEEAMEGEREETAGTGYNMATASSTAGTGDNIATAPSTAGTGDNIATAPSTAGTGDNIATAPSTAGTGDNIATAPSTAGTGDNIATAPSTAGTGDNIATAPSTAGTGDNIATAPSTAGTGDNIATAPSTAGTGDNIATAPSTAGTGDNIATAPSTAGTGDNIATAPSTAGTGDNIATASSTASTATAGGISSFGSGGGRIIRQGKNTMENSPECVEQDERYCSIGDVMGGSLFFARKNIIFKSSSIMSVSKNEFNKKIYKNYICSISVNNTLNCLNIIKELLRLNKKRKILSYYEYHKVEKLLYYKHSFEKGLTKMVYIFLKNNDCLKIFQFLSFFVKSDNINYIIISLIILSQIPLCIRIQEKSLDVIEPLIKVLYNINCKYQNVFVTKYLHICFTNLFIVFKDVFRYQLDNGMERFSLLIKEEYALNILNSLFNNIYNDDKTIVKETLKGFKEACKYEREYWPSSLCSSFMKMLSDPSLLLNCFSSSEAMEKEYMCKILCEMFRTLRGEAAHGGIHNRRRVHIFRKRNLYEIAACLLVHLVDTKKKVSSNVWLALKELMRFKFSDTVNDTLTFFDEKMFLPRNTKVDREKGFYIKKEYLDDVYIKKNKKGNDKLGEKNGIHFLAQKACGRNAAQIWRNDMGRGQHIGSETVNNPPCEMIDDSNGDRRERKGRYNNTLPTYINEKVSTVNKRGKPQHGESDVPAYRGKVNIENTKYRENEGSNKHGKVHAEENESRNYGKWEDAERSNENCQSDNSDEESSNQNKKQKINMYYYKLFVEIFIPLLICIDTKTSYSKNIFSEFNMYLYGNDEYMSKSGNRDFTYVKQENDKLNDIFFKHLKLNLKKINNIYRAYVILLYSRNCLDRRLWNSNISIHEDVIKMIKEYESKNTKSRAEHVLFGNLKNYVHTKKKHVNKDNYADNNLSNSFTSTLTNSILNTLSGTLNYSYDNFFGTQGTVSKTDRSTSLNGRNIFGTDAAYQNCFPQKSGGRSEGSKRQCILQSEGENGSTEEGEYKDTLQGSNPPSNILLYTSDSERNGNKESTSHGCMISRHNDVQNKREKALSNSEMNYMVGGGYDNIRRENSQREKLFEGHLKGLNRSIPFYCKNAGINENYSIFVSSSDDDVEEEASSMQQPMQQLMQQPKLGERKEGESDHEMEGTHLAGEEVRVRSFKRTSICRRKYKKIEVLNKRYNFVSRFKNIYNSNMSDNLLHCIEMLKFLREEPPEIVSPKEVKTMNTYNFFESSLICCLTVIKFVSMTLNSKKLYKATLKCLRNEKITDAEENIGERKEYEQKKMEEIYHIHSLYISTKLEALCSSISKQLCACLQDNKMGQHLPIIKSLSILSILKPSA